ncbi:MAG TPA: ABC transporter substrate-binding protein [Acidimicrobiia bacterium]
MTDDHRPGRDTRTVHPSGGWRPGLAVVGAAVLAVALVACATPPRFGVSTTVVTPTGTCDTSRVVEIGASLALSGSQGPLGREYLTGLKMAVAHVNSTGGVLTHHQCLELLYKDDGGSVPVAQRAVVDLVDRDQVNFLVGPILSAQAKGASAALARSNIPAASFSTLNQTFRRAASPWTFPLTSSSGVTTTAMIAFAQTQGWRRLAVAATDDPVGRQGVASLAASAARRGLTITGEEFIPSTDPADQSLQRLRATHPDGVALVGDTLAVTAALQGRAALAWDVPVVASSIAIDPNVVNALGPSGLAGVDVVVPQAIVAQPGISDADVRAFRDALRTQAPRSLTGSIVAFAQGYDAISMLASAVQSVHSLAAANIRTYLESANYQGLLASYTYTASTHTGIPGNQQVTVPASGLSDGLFPSP